MLEPVESAGTPSVPGSDSRRSASAEASLHTASCFQRSDRTAKRRSGTEKTHIAATRASAPAPFAVSVRFQFVVIVCLLRFPAVVPVASSVRGSSPGPASPNRLRGSSIEFKSVKILFGLRLRSGAAQAAFVQSVRLLSVRFRPTPPGSPPSSVQFGRPAFRRPFFRFTTRGRPPVPLVYCSLRSWFVSFFGSICCSVQFSSVQFSSTRFVLFGPSS